MKNYEIKFLIDQGILSITSHSLSADAAYKVFKFRKFMNSAMLNLGEVERGLLDEVGINDVREFDARRARLVEESDMEELKKMNDQMASFIRLKGELMNDEQEYTGPKITWEEWHALQNENATVVDGKKIDILSGSVELLLEGTLWE